MNALLGRPRRPVSSVSSVEAFVSAERPPAVFADEASPPPPASQTAVVAPTSRLCVEVSTSTLRDLKIRAAERGVTIREYVIALLAKDGI